METTQNLQSQITIDKRQGQNQCFDEMLGDLSLRAMRIPGGTLTMGSPPDELERAAWEGPQHEVSIQPFFMGKYSRYSGPVAVCGRSGAT